MPFFRTFLKNRQKPAWGKGNRSMSDGFGNTGAQGVRPALLDGALASKSSPTPTIINDFFIVFCLFLVFLLATNDGLHVGMAQLSPEIFQQIRTFFLGCV